VNPGSSASLRREHALLQAAAPAAGQEAALETIIMQLEKRNRGLGLLVHIYGSLL